MSVKVGIIGAGFIARYHAMQLALASEPNELVAVYDIDRERALEFARSEGTTAVDDIGSLIEASDAVFVCTWTADHLGSVEQIVAAGLPVFCEKPLATDLVGATRLVEVVEAAGVPNMVGLVLRSSPAMLAMREFIRDQTSGRVMNVVFRDDQFVPTQGMYESTWRADAALAGSGVLLEHSVHDVDILEWLIGRVSGVSARQSHFHRMSGIEDSLGALVSFEDGVTATLTSVWHDILSRPSQRRIEVFCERALVTLEGDIFGPVIRQDSDGELRLEGDELIAWLEARNVPLQSAENQFLAAVRRHLEGTEPGHLDPDVHTALRAHTVVDKLYESARNGGGFLSLPQHAPPQQAPPQQAPPQQAPSKSLAPEQAPEFT
ncbi:MAG: Gfo/Idh/MocA family oxidoreductase [Microthrixaceae bacterium]